MQLLNVGFSRNLVESQLIFSGEFGEGFSEDFGRTTLNVAANLTESAYFSREVGEGFSDEFGGTTLN